ncbi:hypothetical protein DFH28DRAFT_921737 [Melampsora americana]|nr:hypothetical protein DFH28DRAFT_921737 [Melampsora americana]
MQNPWNSIGAFFFVTTILINGLIAALPRVPAPVYEEIFLNHAPKQIGPFLWHWQSDYRGILAPVFEIAPEAEHERYSIKIRDFTLPTGFRERVFVNKADCVGKWTQLRAVDLHKDTMKWNGNLIVSVKVEPDLAPRGETSEARVTS